MEDARRRLMELVQFHCRAAKQATLVPGLTLFRSDVPSEPVRSLYDPRVCIVLQGRKQIVIDRRHIEIGPGDYLVVVLDLPVSASVIEASPVRPHLALTIDLDPQLIAEMTLSETTGAEGRATRGADTAALTIDILEPSKRLVELLDRPADIETLAPLIRREIVYRLLQGELGDMVRQCGTTGSRLSRVARAAAWIKANFQQPLEIAALADMAGMSVTSFHRAFKAATAMSPLQFRTRLRLHEARRLLLLSGDRIGGIAREVGYESQSQFNREYRKMFGTSPGVDVRS